MNRNFTVRCLSMLLALALCFGLLQPMAVFATEDTERHRHRSSGSHGSTRGTRC